MRLREISRHEVQGHDLRSLWRESHALPRSSQADGPIELAAPLCISGSSRPCPAGWATC
jgi:hypothetical protein